MEEGGLRETCLPIHRLFIASKRPSDARLRFFVTTWHCTFHHIAFIPSFRNSSLLYTLLPCSSKRQSARARQLFCSALERECKRKRHWQIDVPDIRAICISTFIHIYSTFISRMEVQSISISLEYFMTFYFLRTYHISFETSFFFCFFRAYK